MTRPTRSSNPDEWLWYLINRLDEHLRDHAKAQAEMLRVRRQNTWQAATVVVTAVAAVASLVAVLVTHTG